MNHILKLSLLTFVALAAIMAIAYFAVGGRAGIVSKLVPFPDQAIPKTTAQQLRGQIGRGQTINPLKALQKRRTYSQARKKVEQAKQNIQQYEKEIVQYKQQLEQYKQTQAGRLQYAKEYGIKPKTITGKLGKGYVTQVLGYEYETPYGKVTDWSPKEKQLQTEAKLVSTYTPE